MSKVFFFLFFFSVSAQAKNFYGLGTFVPYFQKAQVNESGSRQFFDINPYFSMGHKFPMTSTLSFAPELGLAYYIGTAKKVNKRTLFLHYDFAHQLRDRFVLRYGLTSYWYTISGQGGTVSLRNGSSTVEFPAPSKPSTSYFTTLDLGLEFLDNTDHSIRFDLNLMSVGQMKNSAINYILTFNFYR